MSKTQKLSWIVKIRNERKLNLVKFQHNKLKNETKMGNQSVDVKQANLKTIVSQGSNLQASNIVTNVLSGIGENLNKQITKQSLSTLQKQNVDVSPKDIQGITNPVKVDNQKSIKLKTIKVAVMHHS